MQRLTDAVKHLILVNVIVYFGAMLLLNGVGAAVMTLGLYFPTSDYFRLYQLISHMFMHAGLYHLLFNMLGLFFLGPPVEYRLGAHKFLILYFISGIGAMLLHMLMVMLYSGSVDVPVIGASGAVFGVAVGFMFLYPDVKLMLIFPPIPVKAKILIPILLGIDIVLGVSGIDSPIAHFAHVGGAIFGFLTLYYWYRRGSRS